MSKNQNQKKGEKKETNGATEDAFDQASRGAQSLQSNDGVGWFQRSEGNSVYGKCLGAYQMTNPKFGDGKFIQIETNIACTVTSQGEEDEAVPGDVVSIGLESKALDGLRNRILPEIEAGAVYEIGVKVGANQPTKDGKRTFWPMKVVHKRISAPTSEPIYPSKIGEDGKPIPF